MLSFKNLLKEKKEPRPKTNTVKKYFKRNNLEILNVEKISPIFSLLGLFWNSNILIAYFERVHAISLYMPPNPCEKSKILVQPP